MNGIKRIATFEKVSFDQYQRDYENAVSCDHNDNPSDKCMCDWEGIHLPDRATSGSAGYDFYVPYDINIKAGEWVVLPTGVRCRIKNGWFLLCCPKSGLGFKYGVRLANTIGVIDSDYYNSPNEGHIMAKISADKDCTIHIGSKFMQGIFLPFGITTEDKALGIRNGGFGSTGA